MPELLELYERFLDAAAKKELAGMAEAPPEDRPDRRFGDLVFQIMRDHADEQAQRYVVV